MAGPDPNDLDRQKSYLEPQPVEPPPPTPDPELLKSYMEPEPSGPPPMPPSLPPEPTATTEQEKSALEFAKALAARQGVVPADKPWGWARQNKDGDLLYVTPEGERRWVAPEDVEKAASMGMMPMSNVEEFRAIRAEKQGAAGTFGLNLADIVSFGAARWLQRKPWFRMTQEELLRKGTPQTYEVPGETKVVMTPEEQQQQRERFPIASAAGSMVGLGGAMLTPGGWAHTAERIGAAGGTAIGRAVGTGLATRTAQKLLAAGVPAAEIAARITPTIARATKGAATVAGLVTQGAAIGLEGAVGELGMMPEKEYESRTAGDLAKAIAADTAIGAGINTIFGLGAIGIGKIAKSVFPSKLLQTAGTNERQVQILTRDAKTTASTVKDIDGAVAMLDANAVAGGRSATNASEWKVLRDAVDSGAWVKIANKETLEGLLKKTTDLTKEVSLAQQTLQTAQIGVANKLLPAKALVDAEANLAAKKALYETVFNKWQLMDLDSQLGKRIAGVNGALRQMHTPTTGGALASAAAPFSPTTAYAQSLTASRSLAKVGQGIAASIPFSNAFGKGLAALAFGGGTYALTQDPRLAAFGALAPWAIKKAIMYMAGKGLLAGFEAGVQVVPKNVMKIMVGEAARHADDVLQILTDDQKQNEIDNLETMSDPVVIKAFVNGLVASGVPEEMARAIGETNANGINLLLAHRNDNRVDFSKLLAAVKAPQGAMMRISQGRTTKQDMTMLKSLYPEAYASLHMTAKTIVGKAKPSEAFKVSQAIQRALAGRYGSLLPPTGKKTMPKPKGFSPAGLKGGSRGFGSMATAGQSGEARMR